METPDIGQGIINLLPEQLEGPRFTILGVGGAGINVLNTFGWEDGLRRIAVDTDEYFLALCRHEDQLNIGLPELEGRGARGRVDLGRSAALYHESEITDILEGDIILLTGGLGRGTGTGASPVIASLARQRGVPVLAFLVWPFAQEGLDSTAEEGLALLREQCSAIMILDNEAALGVCGNDDRSDAAMLVNDMIAQMMARLVYRVGDAFPFSVPDEIADFVEGLPQMEQDGALRAAELGLDPGVFEPVAMDDRGRITLK